MSRGGWVVAVLCGLIAGTACSQEQRERPRSGSGTATVTLQDVNQWIDDMMDDDFTDLPDYSAYFHPVSQAVEFARQDSSHREQIVSRLLRLYDRFPTEMQRDFTYIFTPFPDLPGVVDRVEALASSDDPILQTHAATTFLAWGDLDRSLQTLIDHQMFHMVSQLDVPALHDTLVYFSRHGTWHQRHYACRALMRQGDDQAVRDAILSALEFTGQLDLDRQLPIMIPSDGDTLSRMYDRWWILKLPVRYYDSSLIPAIRRFEEVRPQEANRLIGEIERTLDD